VTRQSPDAIASRDLFNGPWGAEVGAFGIIE
jgi:hypothetical protein